MVTNAGPTEAGNPQTPAAPTRGRGRQAAPPNVHPIESIQLIELVTPRTNAAAITPAENLLAAITLPEPFILEIAATGTSRRFLVRAAGGVMADHLAGQLAAVYPQADLRRVATALDPGTDPARLLPGEQAAAVLLTLRAPPYLPLRHFADAEIAAARAPQADPVLGILAALGGLPPGWRALSQLVLTPAPDDWSRPYLRLAVEHPLAAERAAARGGSLAGAVLPAGLVLAGALAVRASGLYAAGEWRPLALLAAGAAMSLPALIWLARRRGSRAVYDPRLVAEKLSRIAYRAEVRLAVIAPDGTPRHELAYHLARLATAYRQYHLAAGNGFRPRPLALRGRDLGTPVPLGGRRTRNLLTTHELAGLWHLPQMGAGVPLLERTTARRYLPLPGTVGHGCRIGVAAHQGHAVPVALPEHLLRRHLLLVAKTRRGKSGLLLRLAQHAMTAGATAGVRPALLLVDPHQDLAHAALGLVPPERRDAVVYLDAGDRARPFGLNLLDVGLFPDRDTAVANALTVFKRQFDRFWGPRMEDAFRFALLTLYEVNQAICAADPDGRSRQHTILAVPAVLADAAFRRSLLGLVRDPVVVAWWSGYFDSLDRRLQAEICNPVQTKVQRFAGSHATRAIVGQPRSTIDTAAWLRDGAIVVVNTAKGVIGEDSAALIGATLLNLAALCVGEQAALAPRARRPLTIVVDEFHAMPGADYEAILSELAKYGANLVLATQSLAQLALQDRDQQRALRAAVFANLDGLFAFHTSAEDARYLVPELGAEVEVEDLVALGEHQCYARISAGGERLPVFSVRLDPPPESDPGLAAALAAMSARRYGRDAAAVEDDLHAAFARIEQRRRAALGHGDGSPQDVGVARGAAAAATGGTTPGSGGSRPARNEHRRPKDRRGERQRNAGAQAELFADTMSADRPAEDGTGHRAAERTRDHRDAAEPSEVP